MIYKEYIEQEIVKELKAKKYTYKIAQWHSAKWTNTEVVILTGSGHKVYYSGGNTMLCISKNNFKVIIKRGITKDIKNIYEEHYKK